MKNLGECPKCKAPLKRGLGFNPLGLLLGPIFGGKTLPRPVKCSKCDYKPSKWKDAVNE